MINIAIQGAAGRMGVALINNAQRYDNVRISAAIEAPKHPRLGEDAGTAAGLAPIGVPLTAGPDALDGADVMIDFTFHEVVPANALAAAQRGVAVVLGTTGLSEQETAVVHSAAETVPLLWAANMSLGINLLRELVRRAASILGPDYDGEIVEMHHRFKKDAPSGTALALAESFAQGRETPLSDIATFGREGIVGERPQGELGIHAVRGGDVFGDHTVIFAGDGERIELTHKASSRDGFANGALKASQWLSGRTPGLYDMRDVFGLA